MPKAVCFLRNKSIIRHFNFKPLLLDKIRVHNPKIQWKSPFPVVSHIKIHPHNCLELFSHVNGADLFFFFSWFRRDNFFTGGSALWTIYFSWNQWFENVSMMDLFLLLKTRSFCLLKTLITALEWCGLLVDYCDVFISCLDSHSDGTHSLQRIHWWASDVMLNYSKSVLMKKQTHLHLRMSKCSANFYFGVN